MPSSLDCLKPKYGRILVEHPIRTELTEAEIKQIADYFYAHELNADEELREEGIGSDPVFANVHRQLIEAAFRLCTMSVLESQRFHSAYLPFYMGILMASRVNSTVVAAVLQTVRGSRQ
jgi:hypothetical protein